MKKLLTLLISAGLLLCFTSLVPVDGNTIGEGQQPHIGVDSRGTVRVVFGLGDKIFCATSANAGRTFGKPVLVGQVPDMHLGMSRGPQLASSAGYSVITAIDKSGNIHWFRLNNGSRQWQAMGTVNDLKGSASEGLMGLAADKRDNFYAVWLDIRTGKRNQIYFSALPAGSAKWSKNTLVYQSPDGHVCECCKPNVAVNGSNVAIMFRNWLNGSRDLYVARSAKGGKTFTAPQKLGLDTWKLNGCPMDGGGLLVNAANGVETVWQRKGMVYYCRPGAPEVFVANGRTCGINGDGVNTFITYQTGDTLKVAGLTHKPVQVVGNGAFLQSAVLAGGKLFCVWEQDGVIRFKSI